MTTEKSTLAEKNNVNVYNPTTTPKKPKKPKRKDKSDLGPEFIAPDGGWGWVVCLAAGFSNFCLFPGLQQYGFIYRRRLTDLGFNSKETTTIVNSVMAVSSLIGIVNGATFRRFTFRQVAITGSVLGVLGIFLSAFCVTFTQYFISFSCIYGTGLGLSMAATSLAVNTYFKTKRRRATGFSWTITGLGPIIFPHISVMLLGYYGVQGSIIIYAGIALNALLCAMTLQPVLWHAKKLQTEMQSKEANMTGGSSVPSGSTALSPDSEEKEYECKYCQHHRRRKRSIFSSQYLFNDDDPDRPGYEITEPGTPMLARANDGWYGSKLSLSSEKGSRLRRKLIRQISLRGQSVAEEDGHDSSHDAALFKPNYFNREREEIDRWASKTSVYSKSGTDDFQCTCAEEKALMQKISEEELKQEEEKLKAAAEAEELAKQKMTFRQKVVKFFDLDLLKDFTFVNLALGMTIMMFGEASFSILTPFILNSFGYSDKQISLAMSLLGGMDITVRFLGPFALEKVKLGNRTLFSFGIIAIAVGRLIITMTHSYPVMLAVFILIGFGKGFRTIFGPLIIPSYVPLKRLPAATGLQLVFSSIFTFAFGPILGIITDATSYTVTIHFINLLTCLAFLVWLSESLVRRVLGRKSSQMEEN